MADYDVVGSEAEKFASFFRMNDQYILLNKVYISYYKGGGSMKNNRIRMIILILGVTCCAPYKVVNAVESEEKSDNKGITDMQMSEDFVCAINNGERIQQEDLNFDKFVKTEPNHNGIETLLEYWNANEKKADSDQLLDKKEEENSKQFMNEEERESKGKYEDNKVIELEQLQIPQKLEVIIDPWELDGNGQIYSKPYVIRNNGKTPGVLTLSGLACIPKRDSGVIVRTDSIGLHDDQEKSVYMQMMFGRTEQIVLSEDDSEYQMELQPGEELSVCLTGEVNEYALEEWKECDIAVSINYSWDVELDVEDSDNEDEESNVNKANKEETDNSIEKSTGEEETESGTDLNNEDADLESTDDMEEGEDSGLSEQMRVLEVKEFQDLVQTEFIVDSWKWEEEGVIFSEPYVIQNTGDSTGTFTLTELLCKPAEQSGIVVQSEWDVSDISEKKSVYMELVTESQEKFIILDELSLEDVKESTFETQLEPGEEVVFRFVGKINGIELKEWGDGDIVVTALCMWKVKDDNVPEEN